MKYRSKSKKPLVFLQDFGTYRDEMIVCVGGKKRDILALGRRQKWRRECLKLVRNTDLFKDFGAGRVFHDKKTKSIILILRPYEDCWDYWQTLIHELLHVVNAFAERKSMKKEEEAQAYLIEYLFCHVRKKLQGYEKIEI